MTEEKRLKEIAKWQKVQAKPRFNGYVAYLIFIITLIYTVDEIASQIGTMMKTEIANDLFARFGNSSVGALEALSIIGVPFQLLGLLYRPLSDKFGRKLFLVVNTIGMSLALFLVYLSQSVALYFIGACIIQFFIPHDMHVVYIMETTPAKHRAKIYSTVKFVATLGVLLIPLLRRFLMKEASSWRNVYLIPAIVGLVTSFICLFFARETDTFVRSRLTYLNNPNFKKNEEKQPKIQLFAALKYALKDKQLRWLYIVAALVNVGFLGSLNYSVVMSYGFAENLFHSFSQDAMNAVSVGHVTKALSLFPIGCAVSQLLIGFISDAKGRKASALAAAANCVLAFLAFFFGSKYGMNPYIVGLFCGVFIGSYYAINDVIIMMVGESAPTSMRSSVMSAQFIVTIAGGAISYAIGLPLMSVFGNEFVGVICFGLLVPGFIAALIALAKKTEDTNGANLE